MGIVPRRSHHSPRSWISVYLWYLMVRTTVVTHNIPGLFVVVSSDKGPVTQVFTADWNARPVPCTHTLLILIVDDRIVGSSVPILYRNLVCPTRYPPWYIHVDIVEQGSSPQ